MQIGFISLGCPKNQVDTEIMMGSVSKQHTITSQLKQADIVVVNTCGFVEAAKEEAISTILDTAASLLPAQLLLVTGCLAQRYADELLREMPEIDGLMGVGNPQLIDELITRTLKGERPNLVQGQPTKFQEEGPRVLSTPKGWAYLKIAEGCHNRCSYCAIPGIRGNLRCRQPQSIIAEAQHLVENGCQELVLVAQDTTAYRYNEFDLRLLLTELNQIDGLEWLRVLYAHPTHLNESIIEAMAKSDKVVPYLDLPVQHGHDQVLSRMNRQYNQERVWQTINQLRQLIPRITLRTTVMVGFPGESEEEFEYLKEFVAAAKFNWLGA
ncbi:MAG: MiaB/RimO family radical SAM methylthiotransferase, partial [Methylocystaceae bacterium]